MVTIKFWCIKHYGTSVGSICMLIVLIQANEMVFMNFWYIEHYGESFGDDIDAKMNYFNHIKWLFNVY